MKRVTIKELSKYISLSTSTISRAFANDQSIHPETRQRVLDAAKELGYKPNPIALNLKYGHSKNIGFVVPEMVTPYSANVLRGIQNILLPLGYHIIIQQSDEDANSEAKNLLFLEEFNIDAVIINMTDAFKNENVYRQMMEKGIPLVFFDRLPPETLDVSKVIVEDFKMAAEIVQTLIQQGRKNIAHIQGPPTIRNATERAAGYEKVVREHGILQTNLISRTEGASTIHGRQAMESLLHKRPDIDAVFAFTDTLAIGAMNYLLEKGIKVPEEIAVVSFSGTELATIVFPSLSSVESPLIKMGEAAAELVLEKLKAPNGGNRTIVLEAQIALRASS